MATMIPSNVDDFKTSGEADVYRFFQSALRPDASIIAWYSPLVEGYEPDFILYTPECGLIVFEVKDWLFSQIKGIDLYERKVLLQIGNALDKRDHPAYQVLKYHQELLSMLNKYSLRIFGHKRPLPCSVMWGVIFSHITREEYLGSELAESMPEQRVMLMDDLLETSPLRKDASGQTLRKWLRETFPPKFDIQMDRSELKRICDCICPPIRLKQPRRNPVNNNQADTILKLDRKQEELACGYKAGKSLIAGPAGSGKTLMLAHQAWNLPRTNKKIRKILFVCFNLALVGYIKRLLSRKGVGLGDANVTVLPFYDVCERILGEPLRHADEERDYYGLVVQECLERLDNEAHPLRQKWDAILVDEGQDFTENMATVLTQLLRPDGVFIVAHDKDQGIYQPADNIWLRLCPDMREDTLTQQYRNTKAIAAFAARLQASSSGATTFEGASGPGPKWIQAPEWGELVHRVADAVAGQVEANVPMNEIAILFTRKKVGEDMDLPYALQHALEARGLLSRWASEDVYSKRHYDITTDSVTISTIHSVKGLDFAHVFLLGMDLLGKDTPQNRNLALVGITRAREQLTLGVCGENWLTGLLR